MAMEPTGACPKVIDTWKKLGPFNLKEHVLCGRIKFDPNLEIKEKSFGDNTFIGQFNQNNQPMGIGREYGKNDSLCEGIYLNSY